MAHTSLSCSGACELRKLFDSGHPELSVSLQYALMSLPRSTLNYRAIRVWASKLRIIDKFDPLYLADPCIGSPRMVKCLA